MRAELSVLVALSLSVLASIGLVIIYILGIGNAQLEGVLLAVALGGVGVAIVIWAVALLDTPLETEARHPLASPPQVRKAAEEALDERQITRRRFLVRMLAGAGAALAAALAVPVFSLGPGPGRALFETGWRKGVRVVGEDGSPVRLMDIALDTVRTVFPEGEVGRADSQTLLIRLRPGDLRLPSGRQGWAPDGAVAYSKVCTHAGCPVGLYRAQAHQLLCPCHQSTFDVTRGAVPVFGPAARPLPELPLEVDADGYLVASDAFDEPVGPSFWNMTHDAPEAS